MASRIAQLTLDVHDVALQAGFWAAALDMEIDAGGDGACKLRPRPDAHLWRPTIWLQPVAGPKREKLRLHLDLRPADGDVEGEVERLASLGATRADVGQQADDPFVVLADPEGNEFCVLRNDPL
jgi:hypothetical protein